MQNVNIDKSVKLFAGEKAFLGKNERGLFIPAPAGLCRPLTVCVHDGQFHADELVCIAMLDLFGKTEVDVVRSRKPADWERADLVIDVGEGLLDHHGKRAERGVAACTRLFNLMRDSGFFHDESDHFVAELGKFLGDVAGVDTGSRNTVNHFADLGVFNRFAVAVGGKYDMVFGDAVLAVTNRLRMLFEIWRKESEALVAAAASVTAPREDERIVCFGLESRLVDVKKFLYERKDPAIYFISCESENDWRVLCCAPTEAEFSFFSSKRPIPGKFRGLRGNELSAKAGIEGGIFCHAAGFIAGFRTREAAAAFAGLCLAEQP